jgi:hypothetical protein
MSQSLTYSTFVCPCGFEVRRTGQETVKKLETISRLHGLKCEYGKIKITYNTGHEIKAHKKDMWRENECREIHNAWTESHKKSRALD